MSALSHTVAQRRLQHTLCHITVNPVSSTTSPSLPTLGTNPVDNERNQVFLFVKRPRGDDFSQTWKLQEENIPIITHHQILLRTIIFSVDPYLRGQLYTNPLNIPQISGGIARIIQSNIHKYIIGQYVFGYFPWAKYLVHNGEELHIINESLGLPLTSAVSILGMASQTAYFGLLDAAKFKSGDNVLVSGAAGAVGSIVGQLAKLKGAKRVVGTAGGPDKCRYVREKLGFDECIDYKQYMTIKSMETALKTALPNGIDVYFDNVGGIVTDSIWNIMNKNGRIAICGAISIYNTTSPKPHPNFLYKLIYKSINIKGFVINDYSERMNEFYTEMIPLAQNKRIILEETHFHGFESLPKAFAGLFTGANTGKALVIV